MLVAEEVGALPRRHQAQGPARGVGHAFGFQARLKVPRHAPEVFHHAIGIGKDEAVHALEDRMAAVAVFFEGQAVGDVDMAQAQGIGAKKASGQLEAGGDGP